MAGRQLDVRHFQYMVTIPANTSPAFPQVDPVLIDAGVMQQMELQIPSGHVGLTGFSLQLAGTTIVPWSGGVGFIVAEDTRITVELGIEVDVQLATVCYNTDVFDHSFYFRIQLGEIPARTVASSSATAPATLPTPVAPIVLPLAPLFFPGHR